MDELVQELMNLVNGANGTMTHATLLAAWPADKRGALPKAIKTARQLNLLTQEVKLVDGAIVHTYKKV